MDAMFVLAITMILFGLASVAVAAAYAVVGVAEMFFKRHIAPRMVAAARFIRIDDDDSPLGR